MCESVEWGFCDVTMTSHSKALALYFFIQAQKCQSLFLYSIVMIFVLNFSRFEKFKFKKNKNNFLCFYF